MGFNPATSAATAGVATIAAGDASVIVGGTPEDATIEAGALDAIATLHPPAGAWSNNGQRVTDLADGLALDDAATVGQVTGGTVPIGPAGGVLAGTYPSPSFAGAAFGATGAVACVGNDARLSDSRAPNGAASGPVLEGTYPAPGLSAAVAGAGLAEAADVLSVNVDAATIEIAADTLRVKDLGIVAAKVALATLTDAQIAAANKDGAAGTASMRTLGTGSAQAAAGDDSRLTNSRAPSGAAGGVLDGSYPSPGLAAGVAGAGLAETSDVLSVNVDGATIEINADTLRVKDLGISAAKVANATLTDTQVAAANKDGVAGTASMRTLGTGGAQAVAGNDSRLSDSRAPSGAASGDLAGSYPGPTVATSILGGAAWTVVRKTADQGINTQTNPQNDTHLFFTAAAGAYHEIELLLIYASVAGGATPDLKVVLGEDGTIRGYFQTTGVSIADAVTQANITADQSTVASFGTAAGKRMLFIQGVYIGNGGTFRLKWSQNTSNGNDTTLYTGSILRYRVFA